MPGVPLFTDNHVRGPLIRALRQRGQDVARAVDLLLEAIEDILQKPDAFAYPIEYVKRPR